MDLFSLIILLGVIISLLGGVLWLLFWYFVIKKTVKVIMDYEKKFNVASNLFNQLLIQAQVETSKQNHVSTDLASQLQTQYFNMQEQLQHFDTLSQQKNELLMGDMITSASSCGIDVSSWNS